MTRPRRASKAQASPTTPKASKPICLKHNYRLCYSTFGADQGAMCVLCWQEAPLEVEKELRRQKLQAELDNL